MPTSPLLFRVCCVFGTLLLANACGGSGGTVGPSSALVDVKVFLQETLQAPPYLSYEELVTKLGPPVRVKAEPLAGAASDTLRTVIYHGLELVLQEGAASSSRLAHLALTDARHTSPEGLRVGYAESQVLSTLGLPVRQEPAQLIYENKTPQPFTLVVLLEQRAVSRLEWHFADL